MNVLFLFSDQHHAGATGYAGHHAVKTPHLDGLAAKGASFSNMFTCSGICAPSRTSFFTGTYLRTHEQFDNISNIRRNLGSMVETFKNQGYFTFQTGKSHLCDRLARHFDVEADIDWKDHPKYLADLGLKEVEMTETIKKNFTSFCSSVPEEHQRETVTANRTIDHIKQAVSEGKNFFGWCSFERPHNPYSPPETYDNMYSIDQVPVDWDLCEAFEAARFQTRPMIEDFWKIGAVRQDVTIFQKAVCRYWALISLIDAQIGRILQTLEEQGVADETIIVYTADHGDWGGHFGQLGKNLPGYDDILRIPFIYYDPRREDAGRTIETMHQSVDLFPTFMEACGFEIPPTVQGHSFLKSLDGTPGEGYTHVFAETSMEKTVRSKDWKLTFFRRHPHKGQLFRMGSAPNEIDNRWDDPNYAHVKQDMMEQLLSWVVGCEQPSGITPSWEPHRATRWIEYLFQTPKHVEEGSAHCH